MRSSIRIVELVGVTEIGEMLGVSASRADQLAQEAGFPVPIGEMRAGRIWERDEIATWAQQTGRSR